MASYKYEGNSYFYSHGRWMDASSKLVDEELSQILSEKFSPDEKKKIAPVTKNIPSWLNTSTNYGTSRAGYTAPSGYSKTSREAATLKAKRKHKKARAFNYTRAFSFTSDQIHALEVLNTGANVFLTGDAGTGKSFVLNEFIGRNDDKNIIVCAPTGIAAINVGGSTLHRVFGVPVGVCKPGEYNMHPDEALVKAEIIIIDEISMCRFDVFEFVMRTVQKAESAGVHKQIIVVGDFFQLPPVITPQDKDALETYWNSAQIGSGFAFQSVMWDELHFNNVVLKENVRQKDDAEYIENLNKIRIGDKDGVRWFNTNVSQEPIPGSIYLCGTNRVADAINAEQSALLDEEEHEYEALIKGQVSQSDKMTADVLTLKVGMQVMTLVNNADEGYQNGSIGEIVALKEDTVEIHLNSGKYVMVKPYDWEIVNYEMQDDKLEKVVVGNFKQIPLKIAYAITIHKSQGQTYSSANICPDCFADGQLYVALSRVNSTEGMCLEHDISLRSLKTSAVVKRFYELL